MKMLPVNNREYISDSDLEEKVASNGFAIISLVNNEQLAGLRKLYEETHSFNSPGFFFSIFNNDTGYREKIFKESLTIVESSIKKVFTNYKVAYSGFVIRGPKDEGEFFLHQDPSFVDETIYAPLHVWIPLYDIDIDYAPVCVVPKSHRLSAVHRCNSIPAPFDSFRETVRQYLQPLLLKAGEGILLDPRLFHNSLPNKRDIARPVLLLQLFPKDAPYTTPYRRGDEKLEIYSLPEDFFVRNVNFYENVEQQPASGEFVSSQLYKPYQLSQEEFENFCKENNVVKTSSVNMTFPLAGGVNQPKTV